jgi:hypothetical protein
MLMTIVRLTALVLQNVQVVRGYLVRRVLERERGGGGGECCFVYTLHMMSQNGYVIFLSL